MSRELFEALRRPFEPSDLEWRAMFTRAPKQGQDRPLVLVAPYVNRAALINRLNQVCGPSGWQTDTRLGPGHVSLGLGIRVEDGPGWVWRWDGTGPLDADPPHFTRSDAGKGDFSNAFKRVCEQFGIALYLRELKAMRAILDLEGRYKSKIKGFGVQRWNPPPIKGTPSHPGTIPGYDRTEGGAAEGPDMDEGADSRSSPAEPPQAEPPAELTEEQVLAELRKMKDRVRGYMKKSGYRVYHLDAVVQTHPKLNMRYSDGEELGRLGTLEDWRILADLTQRNRDRWHEAPKELAEEFPTGPERLQRLEELLDEVGVKGQDLIEINTQKGIGWNDAIEWWIEELENR